MKESDLKTVGEVFFLRPLTKEQILALTENEGAKEEEYESGQEIFTPTSFRRALGIVLEGEARVYSHGEGKKVPLRKIGKGELFGAAILFGEEDTYVTTVLAGGKTRILFLSSELCEAVLRSDADAAMRYIQFLSGRIRFLNRRIEDFTAGSAENRLAGYLLSNPGQPYNFARLSAMLDIGRASLYRVMDSFEEKGIIRREGKTILILDEAALKALVSHA